MPFLRLFSFLLTSQIEQTPTLVPIFLRINQLANALQKPLTLEMS